MTDLRRDAGDAAAGVDDPTGAPAPLPLDGAGSELSEVAVPRRTGTSRGWLETVVPPLIVGAATIGLWYLISYVVLAERRQFMLEPPHRVISVGFLDGDNLGQLLDGLYWSTRVALIGLVISIVLGITIAVLMSQAFVIERAVFPFMVMLQAIPILAIVPLISFWFGTGENARVIVCVLISLFPIIVNTLFGLQSADRGLHELFTLQHVSRWTRLRKLMFPAALPALFAGLRISAGLSVIGAIVGDFFFGRGKPGLGQLLKRYASRIEGELLLSAVIVSSLLGVAVFLLFGWMQNRAIGKWHESGGAPR
ncbi:ABC transporter permease [Ilumatobacter sp.]|uniref:ABC transporter permease n=1 Tax=Ilumatobacter sp. TaxID=1967498 RepID=UPI003B51A3AB